VACGNVTDWQLHIVFNETFAEALELLAAGQRMVEIG